MSFESQYSEPIRKRQRRQEQIYFWHNWYSVCNCLFIYFCRRVETVIYFLAWNKLKIFQCRLAAQTFVKDTMKFERIYQKIPLSPRHDLPFRESFLKLVVLLNLPWDVLESRWITLHICITRVSLLAPLKWLLQRDIGQDACTATFRRR